MHLPPEVLETTAAISSERQKSIACPDRPVESSESPDSPTPSSRSRSWSRDSALRKRAAGCSVAVTGARQIVPNRNGARPPRLNQFRVIHWRAEEHRLAAPLGVRRIPSAGRLQTGLEAEKTENLLDIAIGYITAHHIKEPPRKRNCRWITPPRVNVHNTGKATHRPRVAGSIRRSAAKPAPPFQDRNRVRSARTLPFAGRKRFRGSPNRDGIKPRGLDK